MGQLDAVRCDRGNGAIQISPNPPILTPAIELTDEQRAVVEAAAAGLEESDEFSVGGLAGTGKSTIARFLRGARPCVRVLAPTGKAADVLRRKGIPDATTIHSFAYRCVGEVENKRSKAPKPIFEKKEVPGRPLFDDDTRERYAEKIDGVIVDEASMVNGEMASDLRAFGIPILWVGDHGQLPPVGSDPGIMRDPDARLETIHRQAAGSPILRLAYVVRLGQSFKSLKSPDDNVVEFLPKTGAQNVVRRCLDDKIDQILCGFNRTRHGINSAYRAALGYTAPLVKGDRLICIHNQRYHSLFNGAIHTVVAEPAIDDGGKVAEVAIEDEIGVRRTVFVWLPALGRGRLYGEAEPDGVSFFDYGWCVTTHKSQGSEWPRVCVVDEQAPKAWCPNRWRYTAATRAKDRLIVYR